MLSKAVLLASLCAMATATPLGDDLGGCSGNDVAGNHSHDLQYAINSMANVCASKGLMIPGKTYMYWTWGNVQVYYCNYTPYPLACGRLEYEKTAKQVDAMCGADKGGWHVYLDGQLNWRPPTIGRDQSTGSDGSRSIQCGSLGEGVNGNAV